MKLCINCRHLQRSRFNEKLWQCGAAAHPSPVTGLPETKYCFTERREYGECGPEARLFKPISPETTQKGVLSGEDQMANSTAMDQLDAIE